MQTGEASITQLLGQLYDAAQSTGGWPAILEELDMQQLIDGGDGQPLDAVHLRRAIETERSMRRFGPPASRGSIFEIGPLAAVRPAMSTPQAAECMAVLAPHVTHAHRLHGTLESARVERAMVTEAASRTQLAVVMLNAQGEVLQMTPTARAVLAEGDGLALRGKRLRATLTAEHPEFTALLSEASSPAAKIRRGDEHDATGEGAMLITRRSPRRPLQVVVTPVRAVELPAAMQGAVLVFLSDPDAVPASRAPILRKLYGLSPTEGRLVDELAAGTELQMAAKRLRLTVHTARFHLKSIFRKTAVNRQSDLVRLVLSLPGAAD